MSDSFHHHVPDAGAGGHHGHTDAGLSHHAGHSSAQHGAFAANDGSSGPDINAEYGSPNDLSSSDQRTNRYGPRSRVTGNSRPVPAPIALVFGAVFLVLFIAVAAFIAVGVHDVFSDGYSTSVPSDDGPVLDQP